MKNIFYIVVLMLAFSSCQKQAKIGFVDNGILIKDYQKSKDLEAKFEIKKQAFMNKFDSIDNDFQIEAQKFQTEANTMGQAKAQEKYQQLTQQRQMIDQQKQVEAQQFQQEYQIEADTLIVAVKKFVKNYGDKNGYTYILGTSETASTVLYGKEENDLTKTILEALNAADKK